MCQKNDDGTHSRKNTQKFLCGSIAGATAKTIVYPLDRIKMIYQVQSNNAGEFKLRYLYRNIAYIVKNEGFFALWKGNLSTFIRTFPHAGIVFSCFDIYQKILKEEISNPSIVRLLSGGLAGATSLFITYPLDVWNTRIAVSRKAKKYSQVVMYQQHGWKSSFRGIIPSLIGIFPYGGISFLTFETLKDFFRRIEKAHPHFNASHPLCTLICGSMAGLVSQTATYPIDTIRKRMQSLTFLELMKETDTAHKVEHWTMRSTAKSIYHSSGWIGFYRGLSLNIVKGPIASGISFTVHDLLLRTFFA